MGEFATIEGTRAYAARSTARGLPKSSYRTLGRTGCTVSVVGFGGYRIDDQSPAHAAALEMALREGVNLVDTSGNYTDGGSELLVGRVLRRLVEAGTVEREGVVVVSKAGYAQGKNLAHARAREREGRPFPEMVRYMEGCWHCIHPDFLEDQIGRSIERLRTGRIDALLLHNPEYFLSDAGKHRKPAPLEERRAEFYDRIRRAFAHLEREAERGRIGAYGVSSNTFVAPAGDPEATSLTRMWEIAREVGGERHRFSVVQFPMNLFEAGAVLEKNNGEGETRTVLQFAAECGLGVLVNRPLNAMHREGLVRLTEPVLEPPVATLEEQARRVTELEKEYVEHIAPRIEVAPGSAPAADFFRWGPEIVRALPNVGGIENWRETEERVIAPQIRYVTDALQGSLPEPVLGAWQRWLERYLPEFRALLLVARHECATRSLERSRLLHDCVNPFLPDSLRSESLSRKALAILAATPAVTSVLNGMREPAYVEDSLGILRMPAPRVNGAIYRVFRENGS